MCLQYVKKYVLLSRFQYLIIIIVAVVKEQEQW